MPKKINFSNQFVNSLVNNEDPRKIIEKEIIRLVPNDEIDIADLGCGNGRFIDYIIGKKNIRSVLFFDEKADLIENCKKKYAEAKFEKEYFVGDFSALKQIDKRFNVILSGFAIGTLFYEKFTKEFYKKTMKMIDGSLALDRKSVV